MERELVERAMQGDHNAFSELAAASIGRLYGTAGLILRNHAEAEDAVQECLLRAWRDLPRLRQPDRFEAWLRRLLVNACNDALRRSGQHRSQIELDSAYPLGLADSAASVANRDELERGFARLTDADRTVIALRFYLDLSLADIAQALDVPLGTAKARLSRAIRAMQAELAAVGRGATEGRPA